MKPQAALLGSAGGIARGRVRFALELVAGWAVLFAVTELVGSPSWSRWIDAVRSASRATGPGSYAAAAAFAVAACVLAVRAWRIRGDDPGLWALAIAACVNGAVAPLVFLNSQSDVLMLVPLLLLATISLPRLQEIAFAGAAGIFAVSGLFAVTYHSRVAHAFVPLAIAALIGTAIAVAYPPRRLAVLVALASNVTVTLPPLPPRAYDWLGAAGSLAVLTLLGVSRRAGGSEIGRPARP